MAPSLRILALGGLGEIGKNMMVVESGEDIVVVDCGLMFPKADMLGVDLVLPDVSYLMERSDRVRAILITHGHEDHIGALPYVLKDLNVPVYAPPVAYHLAQVKLKEHGILGRMDLHEVHPGDVVDLGEISAEYFNVCHSIPDACGIALRTPAGLAIHTGDFKIDHTPVDGKPVDLQRIAELGREGVLLLMSDSTYAEVPGHTLSEQVVGVALKHAISDAPGRVIVATFASLIARVQQIIDAAIADGRHVAVAGRSMVDNVAMAFQKGYLRAPAGTVVDLADIESYPPEEQVVVVTGAQGEPTSVLVRIASGRHRDVKLREDDTVILSASTIPGNETVVARTIDNLVRQGARVITPRQAAVHVRGHGSQEELKLMLNLVQPRYFVPVHGEYRMLAAHAGLARSVGVADENVFVLEDGDILDVNADGAAVTGQVPAGHIYVDGADRWDVDSVVLRDRRRLSRDGFVVAILPIDHATGKISGSPEVVTSGFVDPDQAEALGAQASETLANALASSGDEGLELGKITRTARDVLAAFLYEQTGRRPMVIPVPIEV
jgi:ribonuclease J